MKIKKIGIFVLMICLSLVMIGCKDVQNMSPQIVQVVDGELVKIKSITYEHVKGTDFHPDDMIENIINDQHIIAIDYDQTGVIWGQNRDYVDISDNFEITSFYAIWLEGDDANFDGVVDDADLEYIGETKTDVDGNKVYDSGKIFLVQVLGVDLNFTMVVQDEEGAQTQISGQIIVVDEAS
ncbi:MAG: hypothetical protein JEZ05_06030 [Tenericutes bacterium]|nr:hypothetical protein [Mycoplasmatota bacterium]